MDQYTDEVESVEEFKGILINIINELGDYTAKEDEILNFENVDKSKLYNHLVVPEQFLANADKKIVQKFKGYW